MLETRVEMLVRRRHILITKPGTLSIGEAMWLNEINIELSSYDN